MTTVSTPDHPLDRIARRLPPPALVGLPFRLCPPPLRRRGMQQLLNHLLGELLAEGEFDYLLDRRLAIEVSDLGLRWVVTAGECRLLVLGEREAADSTIRGRALEFVLLASRLEDPDALFFQRRLEVSGDTAIGLTTRNLLDRLALADLPLTLRIVLNRAGRFARRIRSQREAATEPAGQVTASVSRPAR